MLLVSSIYIIYLDFIIQMLPIYIFIKSSILILFILYWYFRISSNGYATNEVEKQIYIFLFTDWMENVNIAFSSVGMETGPYVSTIMITSVCVCMYKDLHRHVK